MSNAEQHTGQPKASWQKKLYSFRLFLMIVPFMALVLLFCYYPLYGWRYAFYDYKPPIPLSKAAFVGLHWFQYMFVSAVQRRMIAQVMINTFAMSGLGLITSWIPMAFAILLSEIRSNKFKRPVQTLTTLPNFISWVLLFAIAYSFFTSDGMINSLLLKWGAISRPVMFLSSDSHTWLTMWLWQTWKFLGWNAIIYLAAIAGIDQELYEAARVDGAGRFRLIWNITVPGLISTFFVLLMLSIGNLLNNGMEQYFVFQNAFNKPHIQVLDLFVYNQGMTGGSYSLATSIGIMKSLVSLALLFVANWFSKFIRGESIF